MLNYRPITVLGELMSLPLPSCNLKEKKSKLIKIASFVY